MGPLQYMVVGFEPDYFSEKIMPELIRLTDQEIIRIVDILFVTRDAASSVTSRELPQLLPEQARHFGANSDKTFAEWFTQDDIDVVGETLPNDSAVALVLIEHRWAAHLESAVHNASLPGADEGTSEVLALEIEQLLATGSASAREVPVCPCCGEWHG